MVVMEIQVHLVPLDNLVREVCLACLAYLDPRDTEGSLDWMEQRATLVPQEKREKMVPQVLWVLLDPWDLLDLEVREEEMDPQECLDQEV